MQTEIRVLLLETSPAGLKGSMNRYADLVYHCFSDNKSHMPLRVDRLKLTLDLSTLNRIPGLLRNWFHHAFVLFNACTKARHYKADIYHIVDGSHAYIAGWLPNTPCVATAHDIIPMLQANNRFSIHQPGSSARWLIRQSIKGFKRFDRIISDSHNTKNDLSDVARIDPEKMQVIHPPISDEMAAEHQGRQRPPWPERRQSENAYILHVGNNAFYKNRECVLRIFSNIRNNLDLRLKMAGPPPTPEMENIINNLNLSSHVDFVIDPDDAQMTALYQNACLFLFPSLYEGFGWPPLEAMALGCPVVSSSAASLPEVVGEAALMCPADDEEQLAINCIKVLQDPYLAEDLIQRGYENAKRYSMEKFRTGLLGVYREVVGKR